ncbi:DUF3391 domain-containing protein [Solidesulfovibrio sp.]
MLQKIRVDHLRFGMQVVDPGLSGENAPSIFKGDMLIDSTQQILDLIGAGYVGVYVDTGRGYYFEASTANDLADSARHVSDRMPLSLDVIEADNIIGERLSDVKFYGETLERFKNITEFIEKKKWFR